MAATNLCVFTNKKARARAAAALDELLRKAESEKERKIDAEIAKLKSPADVRRWQRNARKDLARILGEFPRRTPLRPRVVGRIDRNDILVEKVILESQPRYYVTANLYIPKGRPLPAPGVLVPCGHAKQGKGYRLYREAGIGLARKGYVAMVYDPTGQGERSECFDPKTRRHIVRREVPQHHYTGKPTFFTGMTLAGYRTWDGVRCLDYLCSRKEVDASRIGVMGNSGGGAMTLLITAVDERVTACAASHPGGSMENTHLRGRRPPDRRLYSLIAPRPCRIIVGDASGETRHVDKLKAMKPFYTAYGCPERVELVWVDGKHDLKTPKREASYEWFNRWLRGPDQTPEEPPFRGVSERALFCTPGGQVQGSIKGQTMQKLNALRARELAPKRAVPKTRAALKKQLDALRRKVKERICFRRARTPLKAKTVRTQKMPGGVIESLVFDSEPGMPVPALLFVPSDPRPGAPVVVHASDAGKPVAPGPATLPVRLARRGFPVLSIDVRDTGETSIGPITDEDNWPPKTRNWRNFNGTRWSHDLLAIRALGIGRSRSAMRVLDVIRTVDLVRERDDLRDRPIVVAGEGRGGIWAMKAAAFDKRIAAAAAIGTLASYRMLTDNPEYNQFEHFWMPGALLDYDVPDLPALVAPRPVWILDPVDQMTRRLTDARARRLLAYPRDVYRVLRPNAFVVKRTAGTTTSVAKQLAALLG